MTKIAKLDFCCSILWVYMLVRSNSASIIIILVALALIMD